MKINDPYDIILHPYITEKSLNFVSKANKKINEKGNIEYIPENKLEFIVKRSATKKQVKKAVEELFEVKVEKVNTRIFKDGKHAIVKLKKEFSAEEVGMRIGVF